MRYEFLANFHGYNSSKIDQFIHFDKCDLFWKFQSLNSSITDDAKKEYARGLYRELTHSKNIKNSEFELQIIKNNYSIMKQLGIINQNTGYLIENFPHFFVIQFKFILKKSFMSKDDQDFYIIDNPIRKEKIFKIPEIAASSWKGNLRKSIINRLLEEIYFKVSDSVELSTNRIESIINSSTKKRSQQVVIFGTETEQIKKYLVKEFSKIFKISEEQMNIKFENILLSLNRQNESGPTGQGRLTFFPSFLDKMDLEVINPHDRNRKVGTLPIYFECAPVGSKGTFSLLYFPFDRIGREDAGNGFELSLEEEMTQDLRTICRGIRDMFTKYGFGAKTSSGFGNADILEESIDIKMKGIDNEIELLDDSVDILLGRKEVEDA